MRYSEGYIVVGTRDNDEGEFGSGWVLVNPGARHEDHGDHGHGYYRDLPSTRQTLIDEEQGNPAHLYVYDDVFYIANDELDGYTRLDPDEVPKMEEVSTGFHRGGGGHITLAVSSTRTIESGSERGA